MAVKNVRHRLGAAADPKLSELYHLPREAEVTRVAVTEVAPVVEEGRFPAKAAVDEVFPVTATVFVEGHARFAADAVVLRPRNPGDQGRNGYDFYAPLPGAFDQDAWETVDRARMVEVTPGLNIFRAELQVKSVFGPGRYAFAVESWVDSYATWVQEAQVKVAAGIDVELMLEEGALLLERALDAQALYTPGGLDSSFPELGEADRYVLQGAVAGLRDRSHDPNLRLQLATSGLVSSIFRKAPLRDRLSRTRLYPLRVDRQRSLAGAWYEVFPRSVGAYRGDDGKLVSGNLSKVTEILPDLAADGFDVLYLTPIHPIGVTNRKGKNASLTANLAVDPGSPWAVGNGEGGHEAVAPELGTIEDFDSLVQQARSLGMEIALDFALQCSPDHPWVGAHPEWFTLRADNTIAYAENPPKKYQDTYPLNFDNDPEGLYRAIREVIEYWIGHGVTIFRMDNPHTKPVRFWQRLAADLHITHPEVVLLAEAFTKPAMMRGLAKVGFHLSYTYFTWRNTKSELTDYFNELAYETAHVLRPALFPLTPDILTDYMTQGPNAFKVRAVLAAMAGPTWGILGGGFEFCEHVQRPGVEEAIDNPKYELKLYPWDQRDNLGIASLNRRLNRIRATHPAVLQLRNIRFHPCDNENILVFSKHLAARHCPAGHADTVLVVVNLDPQNTQEGSVYLDASALGLSPQDFPEISRAHSRAEKVFKVVDELSPEPASYAWSWDNFVRLDPGKRPAHVFSFSRLSA